MSLVEVKVVYSGRLPLLSARFAGLHSQQKKMCHFRSLIAWLMTDVSPNLQTVSYRTCDAVVMLFSLSVNF